MFWRELMSAGQDHDPGTNPNVFANLNPASGVHKDALSYPTTSPHS
jgi:hypothetical protein